MSETSWNDKPDPTGDLERARTFQSPLKHPQISRYEIAIFAEMNGLSKDVVENDFLENGFQIYDTKPHE